MADRLTQLQDCLDDLLMQMFATLNYIQSHHPYVDIPGQPGQAPHITQATEEGKLDAKVSPLNGDVASQRHISNAQPNSDAVKQEPLTPIADMPDVFNHALRELARDLVVQEQKAELLISSLPGIGSTERDQKKRMQELEAELKQTEAVRSRAEKDRNTILRDLDRLIVGIRRVR